METSPIVHHKTTRGAWVPILVTVAVVAVIMALTVLFWNDWSEYRRKMALADILSKMKSLSMATQMMVLDGRTTGDTNLCWPGDGAGTFSIWVANLVPAYLSTNEFLKVMSPPGETLTNMPTKNDGLIRVYAVSADSPPNAVLFATANVKVASDGKISLDPGVTSFGDEAFAVLRKAGDGAVLLKGQVSETNLTGQFTVLLRD